MDESSKSQALRAFEAARSSLAATCNSAQEQLQAVQVSQGSATASQPVAAPKLCESEVTLQGLQESLLRMRQASQAQPRPAPMDMSRS